MNAPVIDKQGYRAGVGAIVINDSQRVFWAKRIGQEGWQFPQGGLHEHETAEQALYRELYEEVGLKQQHVQMLGETKDWLYYNLPDKYIRHHSQPLCIGQKQKWFLLKIDGPDSSIQLDHSVKPEFDEWRWVYYWYPLKKVISFKRDIYRDALRYFESTVFAKKN